MAKIKSKTFHVSDKKEIQKFLATHKPFRNVYYVQNYFYCVKYYYKED